MKKTFKEKIQEKIEKSAWTLAGLPKYEQIRVELVVYAFVMAIAVLGIMISAFIEIRLFSVFTWSLIFAMSGITFLSKSSQFKKFYILNLLQGGKKSERL
jgi:hypothetical protein